MDAPGMPGTPNGLAATYFDGARSLGHEARLLLSADRLRVIGPEVDLECPMSAVRISRRVADTPRWLYLPGGAACVTADNAALDPYAGESAVERTVRHWESRPAFAVLAVALVAALVWAFIQFGVPRVADVVAERIPPGTESALGRQTLATLDRFPLKPSQLDPERRQELQAEFLYMLRSAGVAPPRGAPPLEFRSGPLVGANAFALPGGTIVITDDLVDLADDDREIMAVLAHERGHVVHRHFMRSLLEASATGLIVAGLTGDISSTAALAASAPAILLQSKFSRDNEREADQYAIEVMQRAHISPRYFATMLERLQKQVEKRGAGAAPVFLSSHPATPEREAMARKYAGASAQEGDDAPWPPEGAATPAPGR